ncbi:MAG: TolC family protein, partial [Candidatus Kapaibacteriales bacterium]
INKIIGFYLIFLINLFFCFEVYSNIIYLTLNNALEKGIISNRELKIYRLQVEKSKSAVSEAIAHAFPNLDFTSNFTHFIQKPIFFLPNFETLLQNSTYRILFQENLIPYDNTKFLPLDLTRMSFVLSNQFENKLQLSQILFNSTVFRGIGASKIYLEVSKTNYKSAVSKLITNIKKSYYLAVLLKDINQIYHESLKNAYENLNNIRNLYKQGLVSEFDFMQAEISVENLIPMVQNSENEFINSLNNLKLLLDIPITDTLELLDEIYYIEYKLPPLDETIKFALENNLDIKILEFKRKVDEEMIQFYKSESYPSVIAFANYSFAGQANNLNFTTYTQSLIGVQLSVNLFNGFQTKSRVEQSTIEAKLTEEQLEILRQAISKEIHSKLLDLNKIKQQIETQKRNVELAERAYDIAKTRYSEGTAILLEVKNMELELRQAKINFKQAVFNYLTSILDVENLLGKVNYE